MLLVRRSARVVVAILPGLLAACGSSAPAPIAGRDGEVVRVEDGCEMPGHRSPLRDTVLFIDARAVQPSADATEFASRNAGVRDLLLSVADPNRIQSNGITAFRERVSVAMVPADGSAAQLVFVGCPPGLSAVELAQERKGGSAVHDFLTGDLASKLKSQADAFEVQLIGALTAAGRRATGGAPASVPVEQSPFLAGVKASRALMDVDGRALRLILYSDTSALTSSGGFAAGVTAGARAGGDFHLAEVDLVTPSGRPTSNRDYLKGWFLAQQANLASVGSGQVAYASPPPLRLRSFQGAAAYPSGPEPVTIRIGEDGAGKLAASWLTLGGTPDRSTPMTGSAVCAADGGCAIRSDDGGFAQIWNSGSGADDPYSRAWPFAGMRSFQFDVTGAGLTGKVYDTRVAIKGTGKDFIAVTARATGS